MPSRKTPSTATPPAVPAEVAILHEVMCCRACKWFWKKKPYGPYPAYDFGNDFPAELYHRAGIPVRFKKHLLPDLLGTCAGLQWVLPAPLSGCRKAPIMTIGINPNLTAFWPGVKGATWCYPFLKDKRRYAY